jgi:epoxide hydrolase
MSENAGVRPFHLAIPDAALEDLADRLGRTRLPEPETVTAPGADPDWSQGPPRGYVAELVRYWAQEYDWRRLEAELNAHGQALSEVDGLDVHFLHVRSARPDARPLVLTHGWPSSVVEPLEVIDELANPSTPGRPAFHVVAPSLPGFGFSGKPQAPGWTVDRTADAWAELMARLGHQRFFAVGGDWGGRVTAALGSRHPGRVAGLHTFTPYVAEPAGGPGDLSEVEDRWVADTRRFWRYGGGYSLQQSTRPQTVAYGLVDSPVALLTWVLDKFYAWTDCHGHPENAVSRDRILDTVTLYWLTASGGSSARFYWENFPPGRTTPVTVPSSVSVFPADIEKFPRHWVEARFRDLRSWNVVDRGGHFPMLEVPASFVREVQQALGPMPA